MKFIFNRIIPVSTSSGINLLAGMNKKILANINMVGRLTRSGLDEYNDYLINLNENNRDKEATKIALSYYKHLVRENPQFILKVIWIKWKAFWNIIPRNRGMVAQVASVLSFGILLPFFVLGIIISIRNKKTYLLFFSIANTLIICMIYYANIRYRFPIEPFFIIIASSGILFTYNKLVRHS